MEQKTSFFSLKRFSGVLIGIFWLLAIYLVHMMTHGYALNSDGPSQLPIAFLEIGIISIGVITIFISLLTLWIRAKRKAKKNKQKLWNALSKKQRFNTLIPIFVFLVMLILIVNKGYYSLATPLLLAFFGLLLMNLIRYSSKGLIILALAEIILAVIAYFIYDNEIIFLVIGFGLLPITYGILTFIVNKKATIN